MPILLILIIAGFTLLTMGSPDIVSHIKEDVSTIVRQLPEQPRHAHKQKDPVVAQSSTVASPDFSDPGYQADIPASEVLNQPITPETEINTQTMATASTPAPAYGHQDQCNRVRLS